MDALRSQVREERVISCLMENDEMELLWRLFVVGWLCKVVTLR
jgi:hypothetical protein